MKDWTGTAVQREALLVPCRFCHSPAGTVCVRYDKQPLEAFPCHTCRSSDAKAAAIKEQSS